MKEFINIDLSNNKEAIMLLNSLKQTNTQGWKNDEIASLITEISNIENFSHFSNKYEEEDCEEYEEERIGLSENDEFIKYNQLAI